MCSRPTSHLQCRLVNCLKEIALKDKRLEEYMEIWFASRWMQRKLIWKQVLINSDAFEWQETRGASAKGSVWLSVRSSRKSHCSWTLLKKSEIRRTHLHFCSLFFEIRDYHWKPSGPGYLKCCRTHTFFKASSAKTRSWTLFQCNTWTSRGFERKTVNA